jgi:hypothetical protein
VISIKRVVFFIVLLLLLSQNVLGQLVMEKKFLVQDTLHIDTLSISPGTLVVKIGDSILPSTFYKVNPLQAEVYFGSESLLLGKEIIVSYTTFPIDFMKVYSHKPRSLLSDSPAFNNPAYTYQYAAPKQEDVFGLENFQRSGNITRGFSAGNSQNLSVTSDLNLQLSGMLTPGLQLSAAISDNNIPIQPDGNTQQLQDFDQVFIKLEHQLFSAVAGDFVTQKRDLNFLQYAKKSQGALVNVRLPAKDEKGLWTSYGGAAIARGKYHRYKFLGIEGNQGPYRLQGANNERYIVVLSGTERVYMDGKLLERGETADYIIDYNSAQITFMPRVLVTKDKRFEVEFEYSEQHYSRAMILGGMAYQNKKVKVSVDAYSETDLRSQPLDVLSSEEKSKMAEVGDNLNDALLPSIDSLGYNDDRINYKLIDSLGYDSVFVYSTDPQIAVYQLSFSLVGSGMGDYIAVNSAANGKVFQWVAPINGVPQGEYMPVKILVTPKKRQVVSSSLDFQLSKHTQLQSEVALSVNDLNTFSTLDSDDNLGMATQFGLLDKRPLSAKKDSWQLESQVSWQYLSKNFNPIERIRNIEFERQWNGLSNQSGMDEHLAQAGLQLKQKKNGQVRYNFQKMYRSQDFQGGKNNLWVNLHPGKWLLTGVGAYSSTTQNPLDISFLTHNFTLQRRFKYVSLGVNEYTEQRIFRDSTDSQALASSFRFEEYAAFIQSADTSKWRYKASYKYRKDFTSDSVQLQEQTLAHDLIAELAWRPSRTQELKTLLTYRELSISDTLLSNLEPENTLQFRWDYRLNLWKGAIRLTTFYESNSGLEVKKEYSYLKVADGQGVYSWIDYNENGVKELDEFEVAAFQDQANYIRILLPSDDYIKTYGSRYSLVLNIQPARLWRKEKGLKQVLSRFSNNLMYNTQLRTSSESIAIRANPIWVDINDTNLVYVNSYFRNSLFFNRGNPKFGLEYNYSRNLNKMLMVNGYEGREQARHELKARWNITRSVMLESTGQYGDKSAFSQFFANRDFAIQFYTASIKSTLQTNRKFRIALQYLNGEKLNYLYDSDDHAHQQELNISLRLNNPRRGNVTALLAWIQWDYSGEDGDALAFEMLEGYRTGTNLRWNLGYNRTLLENLQLTLIYDGRKPMDTPTIHTGSVQLRAFF